MALKRKKLEVFEVWCRRRIWKEYTESKTKAEVPRTAVKEKRTPEVVIRAWRWKMSLDIQKS